jgi:hypothetical protein
MTNPVNDFIGATGKAVNQAANAVGNVITTALENPIQIIEVVAVTIILGPEGLALSGTLGSVGTAAVANAAVAAMNGASVENVARAAVGGAAGAYVSGAVATSIGEPPAPGQPPVPGGPPAPPTPPTPPTPPVLSPTQTALLANIAGSAAGSGVQTAIMGGNASQIFQNMGAGALAAGTSAGATALGASPTLANTLGGFVGGRTQSGGTTLSGLAGAAGGASRTGTVIPTTVSSADLPEYQTALMQMQNYVAPAGETPINLILDPVLAAGGDYTGGVPAPQYKPGFNINPSTGFQSFAFTDASGNMVNIPVAYDPATAKYTPINMNDMEALKSGLNSLGIKTLSINPDTWSQLVKLNPDLGKIGFIPGSAAVTGEEIAAITKAFQNVVQNLDLKALVGNAYSENAVAALSSPVLQDIMTRTGNATYVNEILQNIATADRFSSDPQYYKGLLAEVVKQYPALNTAQIQNILNPPLIPLTQQTIAPYMVTNVDITNVPVPAGLPADTVLSVNPTTGALLYFSPTSNQSFDQTGRPSDVTTPTTTPTTTPGTSTTPGTTPGTTTSPATPATPATPKTPEFPTATTTPTTGVDTFTPLTPVTTPRTPTTTTTTPAAPRVPGQPPAPPAPPGAAPSAPPVQISDRPPVTPVSTITPTSTALGTTPAPGAPPTGPSTEKTKFPEFKPETFVYSNVPKTLRGSPFAQQQLPGTGQTVSLGGGAGGVNVESGQPQQAKWNVASLKLKEEAEGTPDYGALSSALGI